MKNEEISVEERIERERKRLWAKYTKIPKDRKTVCEGLVERAAFMRVQLEDMEEDLRLKGWTEPFSQSPTQDPYDRARPIGQFYNSVNSSYQKIIKQLTDLLPPPEQKKEHDDFAMFVTSRRD